MAGALVWRLSTRWRTAVDRAVAPHGLTHATYVLLSTLFALRAAGEGRASLLPPSQRALADAAGLEPMYVSRLIRALEADGLVARTRDERDSRVVRLDLTDRGLAVARPAMRTVQLLLDHLLAPLGGRDSSRSAELVTVLTALLDAPLDAPLDTPIEGVTDA